MTAQLSDIVLYNGKRYLLSDFPLDDFLKQNKVVAFRVRNTASYRGYVADWEIIDDKLYLVKLSANISYKHSIGMNAFFPEESRVFAKWYSGEIRLPDGELLEYVHQGFGSVYERDLFLEFKDGVLINSRVVVNTVPEPDKTHLNDEKMEEVLEEEPTFWEKLARVLRR